MFRGRVRKVIFPSNGKESLVISSSVTVSLAAAEPPELPNCVLPVHFPFRVDASFWVMTSGREAESALGTAYIQPTDKSAIRNKTMPPQQAFFFIILPLLLSVFSTRYPDGSNRKQAILQKYFVPKQYGKPYDIRISQANQR
jgi:hypothetical protein